MEGRPLLLLRRPYRPPSKDDGFVLLIVLVIISLLFPIVIAFNSSSMVSLLQASNFRDSAYALRMAKSGIEGAMALLENDDASYDSENDRWATVLPALSIGEGQLIVRIVDEDRKININLLVKPNGKDVDKRIERHLRNLIKRLGGKPEIVDALIDWMDKDSEITGTDGAEDEYYKDKGYKCKNGPLDTLEELLLVKGFDKELLFDRGLKDFITVQPTDGKINVNTAPIEVLYDLHEELREGLCEEIVRKREEEPFKRLDEVKNVIGISQALYAKISPLIKVNSSIFTIESTYSIGKLRKTVKAIVKREGQRANILFWRESI